MTKLSWSVGAKRVVRRHFLHYTCVPPGSSEQRSEYASAPTKPPKSNHNVSPSHVYTGLVTRTVQLFTRFPVQTQRIITTAAPRTAIVYLY